MSSDVYNDTRHIKKINLKVMKLYWIKDLNYYLIRWYFLTWYFHFHGRRGSQSIRGVLDSLHVRERNIKLLLQFLLLRLYHKSITCYSSDNCISMSIWSYIKGVSQILIRCNSQIYIWRENIQSVMKKNILIILKKKYEYFGLSSYYIFI